MVSSKYLPTILLCLILDLASISKFSATANVHQFQPPETVASKINLASSVIDYLPTSESESRAPRSARLIRSPETSTEEEDEDSTEATSPTPGSRRRKAKVGEVLLPEGYNVNEIPRLKINGTQVQLPIVQVFIIRSLLDFDEVEEEIMVEADTILTWADGQLFDENRDNSYTSSSASTNNWRTLNPIFMKQIWTPDIYIDNLLKVDQPKYLSAPVALKFNQALGFFRYKSRITLTLQCPMEFEYYPADTQKCLFLFKSYAYFEDEVEFSWAFAGAFFHDPSDANFDVQLDKVTREKVGEQYPEGVKYYDALQFYVYARRKLSYHLIQTYLPSIFFILITWLTFLLPPEMVEARIGIAMTTLLTLTAMFSSVRESTPLVSYTKAIDIWMIGCVFFVFLTLLEFTVLAWLEANRKKTEQEDENRNEAEKRPLNTNQERLARRVSVEHRKPRKPKLWIRIAYTTERHAFPIFAIIFVIFITTYWTWLLIAAEYFNWEINPTHNIFHDLINLSKQ